MDVDAILSPLNMWALLGLIPTLGLHVFFKLSPFNEDRELVSHPRLPIFYALGMLGGVLSWVVLLVFLVEKVTSR